jgi:hypothetical protein
MYKYVLYKFVDEKVSEQYLLPKVEGDIFEELDKDYKHIVTLPKGSYKIVDFNGETIFLTKRIMEEGDLIMFCDEEDCTEYFRIEKVKV